MSTSAHQPVEPVHGGDPFDRARAAIGIVVHEVTPSDPKPHDGAAPQPTAFVHVVQAAADGVLRDATVGRPARLGAFAARTGMRMMATAAWLPVYLAVSTVAGMYLLSEPITPVGTSVAPLVYVLAGLAAGLLMWIAGAAATNGDALPARANPRSYVDLRGRMNEAEATIECRVAAGRLAHDAAPVIQLGVLKGSLYASPPEGDWASGIAYVNAWRDLHRIEQALIDVVDPDEFDRVLRHDEMRVEGSKLDRQDGEVRKLIDAAKARVVEKTPDADVRSMLSTIRSAVDDFRDRRFEALVRNRMYVDRVSLLLGLAAWALLSLAILAGAERVAVASVSAFYLIGAAMGLFTQLRSGVGESLEDAFGYGHAQLRQTVLLSGLAGVAGVFLTTVAGAAAVAGAAPDAAKVTITAALAFSPVTAVTAAAFGLAPGALTDQLNSWAKKNIRDLESTTTAASGPARQG
jgi:hypothetical protein